MLAAAHHMPVPSEDKGALARMVMALFDHWQIDTEDQAALLGLASGNRAFGHRTPVELVRDWGFAGLLAVRAYLDRARGQ